MLYDAIPDFERLAPAIWDRISSISAAPSKNTGAPFLILLMTWTGAHSRHIFKYTSEYSAIFPSARIVVITTSAADFVLRDSRRKQQRLQPAVKYIADLQHASCRTNGGILMHIFSEGGSNKACELATAYQHATGTRLPISALYLDSTPGHPRYLRLYSALAKSFPPIPVLKQFAIIIASVLLGLIWILHHGIVGYDRNPVSRSRRQLLDPELFDLKVPRCYLYSKNDALIAWQDIREHAGESMKHGGTTTEIFFETSGHVDHARHEPARYWDAIITVWRQSQDRCNEKGTQATGTIDDFQLPEFEFEDGIIDLPPRMSIEALVKKNR